MDQQQNIKYEQAKENFANAFIEYIKAIPNSMLNKRIREIKADKSKDQMDVLATYIAYSTIDSLEDTNCQALSDLFEDAVNELDNND